MSVSQDGFYCRSLCVEYLLTSLPFDRQDLFCACVVGEVAWLGEWVICDLGRAQNPGLLLSPWSFRPQRVSLQSLDPGWGRRGLSASCIASTYCLGQWGSWGQRSQWIRPELQPPVPADLSESKSCQTSVLSAAEERGSGASLGTSFLTVT